MANFDAHNFYQKHLHKISNSSFIIYLENDLHGVGNEPEPAVVFLHGGVRGGIGGGNGGVGESVEKAFGSGEDSGEIDMRVEGIDGRKVFMEAELDSGGDES